MAIRALSAPAALRLECYEIACCSERGAFKGRNFCDLLGGPVLAQGLCDGIFQLRDRPPRDIVILNAVLLRCVGAVLVDERAGITVVPVPGRSEEHTSELQSLRHVVL